MIPKLKKLLKKTLIQAYIQKKDNFFTLESTLRTVEEEERLYSSAFLTGSNIITLNEGYCSKNLNLKLPAILKVFDNFESLVLNLVKIKNKLGFSNLILVKKNNLIFKNQVFTSFIKNKEKRLCINIILIKNLAFLLGKSCIKKEVR